MYVHTHLGAKPNLSVTYGPSCKTYGDIMRQAAESIHDFLKFTGEVAKEGNSIPVLDTQMWVGSTGSSSQEWCSEWREPSETEERRGENESTPRATVWYCFYKKPVAS